MLWPGQGEQLQEGGRYLRKSPSFGELSFFEEIVREVLDMRVQDRQRLARALESHEPCEHEEQKGSRSYQQPVEMLLLTFFLRLYWTGSSCSRLVWLLWRRSKCPILPCNHHR
jgi:hypothetical protein